jgi:hypothetical protein
MNKERSARWSWPAILIFQFAVLGNVAAQKPREQTPDPPRAKLPAFLAARSTEVDPRDNELRKLHKARYQEVVAELRAFEEEDALPTSRVMHLDDRYLRWQRVVQAGLELCDNPAEKVMLLTHYVEMTRNDEKDMKARREAGRVAQSHLHRARYERLHAEVQLLKAKREATKPKVQ